VHGLGSLRGCVGGLGASGDMWGALGASRGYVSGLGASEMYGLDGEPQKYGAFGRAQEAFQNCKRITELCSITVDHNRACQTYTAMPITTATVNDYSA